MGVAIIGCGLIGRRRAAVAAAHDLTRVAFVVDVAPRAADQLAATCGATAASDWRDAVERPEVSIVVVATPNAYLAEIGAASLEAGKHVLVEKPPGRNLRDAERLAAAARASGKTCKIGFNHRHHPALRRAHELYTAGAIGRAINLRARHGHGARPGCEHEWRADPALAGGGELLDQGIHIIDLFRWFAGEPSWTVGVVQTAVWPIAPLEDNAFGLLRFEDGVVGQMHVSMTQWKNLFSFEVSGECGALIVEGLAGSYGRARLRHVQRRPEGGEPNIEDTCFDEEDSFATEWAELVAAVLGAGRVESDAEDGVRTMRVVEALYRSARDGVATAP